MDKAGNINTQVCTFSGCFNRDASPKSAWSVAAEWWTCHEKPKLCRDCLCGTCCLPCQVGVLTSDSGDTTIPGDLKGWTYCCGICLCTPLLGICIASVPVNEINNVPHPESCIECSNGNDFPSAFLWTLMPLCTCAHCIIAEQARIKHAKNNTKNDIKYSRF